MHDLHVHLAFVTTYRRNVFTDEILSRCADVDAELRGFTDEGDHAHLLVHYFRRSEKPVNYEIFSMINGLAGRFGPLDVLMVVAAQYLIFLLFAAGAVVTVLRARQDGWWPAGAWRIGQVAATLLLGFALSVVVRMFGLSQRPFQTHDVHMLIGHAPGVSLPSDHSTASFAVAIAVWFFVSAKWGPYFTAAAALIAVSRVFVGVHYPADITAGALVAMVAGLAVWGATLLWRDPFLRRFTPDQVEPERALESTV